MAVSDAMILRISCDRHARALRRDCSDSLSQPKQSRPCAVITRPRTAKQSSCSHLVTPSPLRAWFCPLRNAASVQYDETTHDAMAHDATT